MSKIGSTISNPVGGFMNRSGISASTVNVTGESNATRSLDCLDLAIQYDKLTKEKNACRSTLIDALDLAQTYSDQIWDIAQAMGYTPNPTSSNPFADLKQYLTEIPITYYQQGLEEGLEKIPEIAKESFQRGVNLTEAYVNNLLSSKFPFCANPQLELGVNAANCEAFVANSQQQGQQNLAAAVSLTALVALILGGLGRHFAPKLYGRLRQGVGNNNPHPHEAQRAPNVQAVAQAPNPSAAIQIDVPEGTQATMNTGNTDGNVIHSSDSHTPESRIPERNPAETV